MVSNQILQSTVNGLAGIAKVDICLVDTEGKIPAASFSEMEAEGFINTALAFVDSPAESQVALGSQFFKVYDEQHLEYVLIVKGDGDEAYTMGKVAAFQIESLLTAYKERFDKDNFIKNLLLDNLLLIDIYNRAKKLHIEAETRRVVFLIETNREKGGNKLERVRNLLANNKYKDFVTAVDGQNIVVVKEVGEEDGPDELYAIGQAMLELFAEETDTRVAYGTAVGEIREVSRSYKEAHMALDVGKIFFEDRKVVAYSTLGIGRLIYQLPIPLCIMFIKEIFEDKSPDGFDEETLETINKFFENSLNVSETSRQLFIHRNTLVYRLDKLQKSTGLDLRIFEDAITFKIALMVARYMKHMEVMDF